MFAAAMTTTDHGHQAPRTQASPSRISCTYCRWCYVAPQKIQRQPESQFHHQVLVAVTIMTYKAARKLVQHKESVAVAALTYKAARN